MVGSAGYGASVDEEMEVDELKVFHKIHSHVQVIEVWSSIRNINRDKKVPFATQTVDCFIEQVYKKGHMK
ncbi:hypothetical protein NC651_024182 [Populus alba x Populus x berolinensis]|nr:hypothetical protein NC651_024182 [Populus alba x Populus x berolinensis]